MFPLQSPKQSKLFCETTLTGTIIIVSDKNTLDDTVQLFASVMVMVYVAEHKPIAVGVVCAGMVDHEYV